MLKDKYNFILEMSDVTKLLHRKQTTLPYLDNLVCPSPGFK